MSCDWFRCLGQEMFDGRGLQGKKVSSNCSEEGRIITLGREQLK